LPTVTVTRVVQAPVTRVFAAVAHPRRFAQAIGGVTRIEDLSDVTSGVGTRFRQTRVRNGRETTMDFAVTEYVENERIRILNETHGTVWDSLFTFAAAPQPDATTLRLVMDARTSRPFTRLLLPLVCRLVRKGVTKDIDAVKAWCEDAGR
jgi:uncharacterized protein YndB with AHSA1/START domain